MRVEQGYLVIGRWGGAPVRLHWTLPLGAFVFGQLRIVPGFWFGFFLLVLIHELGHALVVRRQRCRVLSVEVHGLGGVCRWEGQSSAIGRAKIAWGGVNAQCVALLFTAAALGLLGEPRTPFAAQLVAAFTTTNVWMIAINLIPVPPLDGAEAWKLFPLLRQQRRQRSKQRARAQLEAELAALAARDREPPPPEVVAAVDAAFRKIDADRARGGK
jgi:Zn-dependent protease